MFTSLKSLKWAHNLGVKQERQRIAAELQLQQQRARTFNEVAMGMLRDTPQKELTKQRRQRLDLQIAVNNRIQEIVDELFRAEELIAGSSIMFPDIDEFTRGGKK